MATGMVFKMNIPQTLKSNQKIISLLNIFIILYYETVYIIMKHKPHHNGPNYWLVSPLSVQASCTPDMECVVKAVSSHIVQSVLDHLFKIFHNILVLRQVPVLSELLVPRTHHDMALGIPRAHHIPRFRTSWTCPQVTCMLLITLKVHFDCGSHATINFEAQAGVCNVEVGQIWLHSEWVIFHLFIVQLFVALRFNVL